MPKLKPVVLDKIGAEGLTNIKIRLTHKGKSREIRTPYYIPYKAMGKNGIVKGSYTNHASLNKALRDLMDEYYAIIDKIGPSIRYKSMSDLIAQLRSKDLAKSFNTYAQNRITKLRQEGRMSYAESYEVMLTHLKRYKDNLSFEDMSENLIAGFDSYLKVKGAKTNTRRIYLNNIRAIFNHAVKNSVIDLPSPFKNFEVKQERSIKRALDVSDIRKLKDGHYPEAQQRSVDIFMMIIYLNGINLKDLLYLKPGDLKDCRIECKRAKTDEPLNIKVFPQAKQLIDKWHGKKYLLKFLDNDDSYENYKNFLNETNKRLRKAFGGRISTYYARHSVASFMADLEIPIEFISMTLGHELPGSKMTNIYIKYNLTKVDEAMEKLISFINSTKTASETKALFRAQELQQYSRLLKVAK